MNRRVCGARRQPRAGTAATELAILLPFLALMFAAALDFGRVFNTTQVLEASASAGALYASGTAQTSSSTGNVQAAQNAACAAGASLVPPLQTGDVTVTVDDTAGTATVTVAYDFALLTPILGASSQIHLTRTVTCTKAPQPGN
jgi:Flp pilus assembly protein TadG